MSKSAIYATGNSTTSVAVGNSLPVSQIVRRFGPNINLIANEVKLNGAGYYNVQVSATLVSSGAGTPGIILYQDGQAVAGAQASSTATAASQSVTIPISALVRVVGCCDVESNLTLVVTGQAVTPSSVSVVVEKL